jgi:hypothetical protein
VRRRPTGLALTVVVAALAAAACTGDGISIEIGSSASPSAAASPAGGPDRGGISLDVEPIDTGEQEALAAMGELCVAPTPVSTGGDGAPPETPADVLEVEGQVEQVRELDFLQPVAVQPVSVEEIAGKLEGVFDETYPEAFYDRRTVAWQTLGVIPRDVTIRDALLAFQTGQVVGFYNPVDGELVYQADGDLDVVERVTLAHELTHAIDDQHFDLERIDAITARCRDEAFQAALGAVEGSAQFFAVRVLSEFPPVDGDFGDLDGGGVPGGVPPFIADQLLWPYTAGQSFVTALESRGGVAEVDEALRTFPVSTEQILHPERYPTDRPTPLEVPDISRSLGPGWGDLDVMQIGESWLASMLELRLEPSVAASAAAGWDGGIYRAFTDGSDAVVVVTTAWDTSTDADAFAQAVREWFAAGGQRVAVGPVAGTRVRFAVTTADEPLVHAALEAAVA